MSYTLAILFLVMGVGSVFAKSPHMESIGLFAVSALFAIAGAISNNSMAYMEGKISGINDAQKVLDKVLKEKAEKEEK